MQTERNIAYFSMEIGYTASMPTYSGGLGVLAGDTLRSASDLRVPMVAVSLLHRQGYFHQILGPDGEQREEPVFWDVGSQTREVPSRVSIQIENRPVLLRAWQYEIKSAHGYVIPVYLLDTDLPENTEGDRHLTDKLYGGDGNYRLCQEAVLGIGGVRMLRALGYESIDRFHMNEGHAALLSLELLNERIQQRGRQVLVPEDIDAVRRQCVFTTHTPVPAGHDAFHATDAERLLEPNLVELLRQVSCLNGTLNMTHLALRLSEKVNGVSMRHGEVSRKLFSPHPVEAITNGIHGPTWVCSTLARLYDRYVPGWREDAFRLHHLLRVPKNEFWAAHVLAKQELLDYVARVADVRMYPEVFTIGFARRAAEYKRADLFFSDLQRLIDLHHRVGPIQIIYGGKAHPSDQGAKALIKRLFQAREALRNEIKFVYLPDYDMRTCAIMVAGVDVWLNTPKPPLEASGTSGMKAAVNGVPSLSVLDGWWVEGCIEGVTGWAIGEDDPESDILNDAHKTAKILYDKLEFIILPMFYRERDRYLEIMRHTAALNGARFSTQRMVLQYAARMYA